MAGLETCPKIASINGITCPGLVTGGLTDLCVAAQDEGLALGFFRFLARSGATLTSLDLRCCALYVVPANLIPFENGYQRMDLYLCLLILWRWYRFVRYCWCLVTLQFGRNNELGPEGGTALATALVSLTVLEKLDLE